MSDMIERVKAKIAEKFAPAIDFKAPYAKVMLDMAARAAIEAMRSQPPGTFEQFDEFGGSDLSEDEARRIYEAVIDAALKEPTK